MTAQQFTVNDLVQVLVHFADHIDDVLGTPDSINPSDSRNMQRKIWRQPTWVFDLSLEQRNIKKRTTTPNRTFFVDELVIYPDHHTEHNSYLGVRIFRSKRGGAIKRIIFSMINPDEAAAYYMDYRFRTNRPRFFRRNRPIIWGHSPVDIKPGQYGTTAEILESDFNLTLAASKLPSQVLPDDMVSFFDPDLFASAMNPS